MLGRDSGLALVERLRADPATFGRPKIVVIGAALDAPGIREHIRRLGVWRSLCKPVPLAAIEACVVDALGDTRSSSLARPGESSRSADAMPSNLRPVHETLPMAVVDTLFGGDLQLYTAYRDACTTQFRADVAAGDAFVHADDRAGLHRLAHNLRGVLRLLGEASGAVHAERLENLIEKSELKLQTRPTWQRLRAALIDTIDRA